MTARTLVPPLLKAGTLVRDQAIKIAGQQAYIEAVQTMEEDRWGVKKNVTYESKEIIYVMSDWPQGRVADGIYNVLEERDETFEVSARVCDDINDGDLLTVDIRTPIGLTNTAQYKIVEVQVRTFNNYLGKVLIVTPYRTDNF